MHGGWMQRKRKIWSASRITVALEKPGGEGGPVAAAAAVFQQGGLKGSIQSNKRVSQKDITWEMEPFVTLRFGKGGNSA